MAFDNVSRVLASWTLPSESLSSRDASSTVLSSFDASTAFTAVRIAFTEVFAVFALLSAFTAAVSRPSTSDASQETMPGVFTDAARFSLSMVFGSFTVFGSVFDVRSASSMALSSSRWADESLPRDDSHRSRDCSAALASRTRPAATTQPPAMAETSMAPTTEQQTMTAARGMPWVSGGMSATASSPSRTLSGLAATKDDGSGRIGAGAGATDGMLSRDGALDGNGGMS